MIKYFAGYKGLVSMRRSVNMVADRYARRQRLNESFSQRECPDRRRSYQRDQEQ